MLAKCFVLISIQKIQCLVRQSQVMYVSLKSTGYVLGATETGVPWTIEATSPTTYVFYLTLLCGKYFTRKFGKLFVVGKR